MSLFRIIKKKLEIIQNFQWQTNYCRSRSKVWKTYKDIRTNSIEDSESKSFPRKRKTSDEKRFSVSFPPRRYAGAFTSRGEQVRRSIFMTAIISFTAVLCVYISIVLQIYNTVLPFFSLSFFISHFGLVREIKEERAYYILRVRGSKDFDSGYNLDFLNVKYMNDYVDK